MTIKQEIVRTFLETGLSAIELSEDAVNIIREQIIRRFANERSNDKISDRIRASYKVHSTTIWEDLNHIVPINPIIMFFEEGYEKCGFIFDSVNDLVTTLAESYHYVFYLTDLDTHYILCYTDHDMLIAGGLAAHWLENYCSGNAAGEDPAAPHKNPPSIYDEP